MFVDYLKIGQRWGDDIPGQHRLNFLYIVDLSLTRIR